MKAHDVQWDLGRVYHNACIWWWMQAYTCVILRILLLLCKVPILQSVRWGWTQVRIAKRSRPCKKRRRAERALSLLSLLKRISAEIKHHPAGFLSGGERPCNQIVWWGKTCPKRGSDSDHCKKGWVTGFEPATSGITIRRSNQLSYTHHMKLTDWGFSQLLSESIILTNSLTPEKTLAETNDSISNVIAADFRMQVFQGLESGNFPLYVHLLLIICRINTSKFPDEFTLILLTKNREKTWKHLDSPAWF